MTTKRKSEHTKSGATPGETRFRSSDSHRSVKRERVRVVDAPAMFFFSRQKCGVAPKGHCSSDLWQGAFRIGTFPTSDHVEINAPDHQYAPSAQPRTSGEKRKISLEMVPKFRLR
ncbi:hypothetical protein J6590_010981 [Homalodisca vitripennis]|nr:hypothetical protein J6590_010981 [Homalodisca vitripennis]